MEFKDLGVSAGLTDELKEHGIVVPTKVQEKVIPLILDKKDVLVQSETGSGKTIGFAIPTIDMIKPIRKVQVLVIAPTRELALQVAGEYDKFSKKKGLNIAVIYGGVSINNQFRCARTADVVVGTPGRLLDMLERQMLNLTYSSYLILDEADRLMDMGFIDDINRIIRYMPMQKQCLMFSATINKQISSIVEKYMNKPVKIFLENIIKKAFIEQYYYEVSEYDKISLLVHLLTTIKRGLTLVFCNTKRKTTFISHILRKNNIHADCINGDISQRMREEVMRKFATGRIDVLVATDVAARGIHIEDITHVVNFDLPEEHEMYTHRIGRTGRNGKKGTSIAFYANRERLKMEGIMDKYGDNLQKKPTPEYAKLSVGHDNFSRNRFQRRFRRIY